MNRTCWWSSLSSIFKKRLYQEIGYFFMLKYVCWSRASIKICWNIGGVRVFFFFLFSYGLIVKPERPTRARYAQSTFLVRLLCCHHPRRVPTLAHLAITILVFFPPTGEFQQSGAHLRAVRRCYWLCNLLPLVQYSRKLC